MCFVLNKIHKNAQTAKIKIQCVICRCLSFQLTWQGINNLNIKTFEAEGESTLFVLSARDAFGSEVGVFGQQAASVPGITRWPN